jgi:hypothetical protein
MEAGQLTRQQIQATMRFCLFAVVVVVVVVVVAAASRGLSSRIVVASVKLTIFSPTTTFLSSPMMYDLSTQVCMYGFATRRCADSAVGGARTVGNVSLSVVFL